jgi:hypothetical protein
LTHIHDKRSNQDCTGAAFELEIAVLFSTSNTKVLSIVVKHRILKGSGCFLFLAVHCSTASPLRWLLPLRVLHVFRSHSHDAAGIVSLMYHEVAGVTGNPIQAHTDPGGSYPLAEWIRRN